MKGIRFMVDFFAVDGSGNRYVKYRQGEVYPPTEETTSQVIAGFAEEVDVEIDVETEEGATTEDPQAPSKQESQPEPQQVPQQNPTEGLFEDTHEA
jgi:hypothetical protein